MRAAFMAFVAPVCRGGSPPGTFGVKYCFCRLRPGYFWKYTVGYGAESVDGSTSILVGRRNKYANLLALESPVLVGVWGDLHRVGGLTGWGGWLGGGVARAEAFGVLLATARAAPVVERSGWACWGVGCCAGPSTSLRMTRLFLFGREQRQEQATARTGESKSGEAGPSLRSG